MKLTDDLRETLHEHSLSTCRPYSDDHKQLERAGLIVIGIGRWGKWSKITEAGRQHLARSASRGARAPSPSAADPLVVSPTLSISPPVATPRKRTPPRASSAPPQAPIQVVEPNAVRRRVGQRVTYYPLSSWGSIHGDKCKVRTGNKVFRSYPVAASGADEEVL